MSKERWVLYFFSKKRKTWSCTARIFGKAYFVLFLRREILTSVSRSEEEMVEQVGDAVSKVLNEADPEISRLLISPSLAFSGLSPKGHPSCCTQNSVEITDGFYIIH